jgi:uncharacterized protein (TIGR03067 family)
MTRFAALFGTVASAALLIAVGAGQAADTKSEVQKFQGTWYSYAIEVNGSQQTGENRESLHIFSGNKWIQKLRGQIIAEGTFTVQEQKPYWVIDSLYTSPKKHAGAHWLAMYRFDGDTVQWIGTNRDPVPTIGPADYQLLPKVFETKRGDGMFMRTSKRLKD